MTRCDEEDIRLVKEVYMCPICTVQSGKKCVVEKHIREVHLRCKDFECLLCDKAFSRKFTLEEHMKCIHGVGEGRRSLPDVKNVKRRKLT